MASFKLGSFLLRKIGLNTTFRIISLCLFATTQKMGQNRRWIWRIFLFVLDFTSEWLSGPIHSPLICLSLQQSLRKSKQTSLGLKQLHILNYHKHCTNKSRVSDINIFLLTFFFLLLLPDILPKCSSGTNCLFAFPTFSKEGKEKKGHSPVGICCGASLSFKKTFSLTTVCPHSLVKLTVNIKLKVLHTIVQVLLVIIDKTTETRDQRHRGRQSASLKNVKGGAFLVRSDLNIAEDIHTGVVRL